MYDERSVTSARDRALLKISPKFFGLKSQKYYEKIILENHGKDFDFIFVIKCDMIPEKILEQFRKEFPNAKLCLYLYDSVRNIPGIEAKFKYFDTVHSFDSVDCQKEPRMKLRPLFFGDVFRRKEEPQEIKHDICFVGTIHSDRYAVIRRVREIAREKGLSSFWFCYLQSKFMYYFYKATKKEFAGTSPADFDFVKMSSQETAEAVNASRIVLDVQHPKQTGLTMRTIEMIGMEKKLITTNEEIRNYDFYNPNNICIVDRHDVQIDEKFLQTPYEPLEASLYEKYSLSSWILDVLN